MKINPKKLILEQYWPLFYERHAHKVTYSGRNSGKSVNIIRSLLLLMLSHRDMVIVCAREIMASIEKSSYAEIRKQIREMGLDDYFKVTKTNISCPATGGIMHFVGLLRNIESVKGIADINIIWYEEAATISLESLTMANDTLRESGAESWYSFNPKNPQDAVSQMFLENKPPPNTIIISTNYDKNPFVNADKLEQIEFLKETDFNQYSWRYLGKYLDTSENNIFSLSSIKLAIERDYDIPKGFVKAGLDVAGEGDDKMVLVIMQGDRVLHIQDWNYMDDEEKFVDILMPILYHWKVDVIGIDMIGIGHGMVSVIKRRFKSKTVIGVDCRRKSLTKECDRIKDEMIWKLKEHVKNGLSIPNHKGLVEDLQVSRYEYNNNDEWKVLSKDKLKKDHGFTRSTDYLDATAIANYITVRKVRDLTSISAR